MKIKQVLVGISLALATMLATAQSNNVSQAVSLSVIGDTHTGVFGALHNVGSGSFTDTFTFPAVGDYLANSIVSSISFDAVSDITFYSLSLNGNDYTMNQTGTFEVWSLPPTMVGSPIILTVTGTAGSNASYSGTMNLAPVPEPQTYAMVMAAIGLVGWASYKRRA